MTAKKIASYSALLPYFIIPFRAKSAKALFLFLKTIIRDFFWLQFSVKFKLKKIPVVRVGDTLDDAVPFDPSKINIYLDFVDFWIRPMTFLFKRFGIKKALPYCTDFLYLIETAYSTAAQVYRFRMSTTERPHYTKTAGFRMIHALDPHLLCVPSLHVVIVTLARIYYGGVFKQLHIDEAERKLYEKELKDGANDIIETVLYIKQHSVNCIPAALYMLLYLLKDRFTIDTAVEIINGLFENDDRISLTEKNAIHAHIHYMFERLLLHGVHEDDWAAPIKRWLIGCEQKETAQHTHISEEKTPSTRQ
jgi:hypothetical protein